MAQLLGEWKKLAEGWSEAAPQAKLQQMRTALARGGWPIEFLAKSAVSTGLRPALFSSPCSEHNPKDGPLHKIWRAQAFAKGVEDGQIVFTRGDTEFKIRPGELIQLRPVIIHPEGAPAVEYWLPLDETPLYWEKNKLSLIVESEGNYALLTIPANGKWEVSLPPESDTSVYLEDRTDVACPKTAKGSLRPWFQHTHCQKILNKDSGKTVIAQFYQSC